MMSLGIDCRASLSRDAYSQVASFCELLMEWGLPPLQPQLGAARLALTTARQARRGDRTAASNRNSALALGSAARRHNARAQKEAVIEVLRCINIQMVVLQRGLAEGMEAEESGGRRFLEAFKCTQMWLGYEENNER
jgi:hypothetical protein